MYTIKQISLDELKFYSHNIDQNDIDYHYNLLCSTKSPLPIVFYVNYDNFVLSHIPYVMALIKYVKIRDLDFKPYCFVISNEQFSKLSNLLLCEFSSNNTKSLDLDLNELESTISDLSHELDMYKKELIRIGELIKKSKEKIKTHPKVVFKYHRSNPIEAVIESTEFPDNFNDPPKSATTNIKEHNIYSSKENESESFNSLTKKINTPSNNSEEGGNNNPSPSKQKLNVSNSSSEELIYHVITSIKNKSSFSLPTNFKDLLNHTDNLNSLYDLCKAIKGKRRLTLPNAKNKSEMIKFILTHIKYRL